MQAWSTSDTDTSPIWRRYHIGGRYMIGHVDSTASVELDNNVSVGHPDWGRRSGLFALLCADLGRGCTDVALEGVVDDITQRHGGTVVAGLEDTSRTASVFAAASDAMKAALEMCATLGTPLAVDLVELDGDPSGTERDIDRCWRLLDVANEGQVLASSAAWQVARRAVADLIQSTDLGVHEVRGRPDRVWIWQVDPVGAHRSFPPLRTREAMATTLPLPGTAFVGREADVAALAELIEAHRVVSIVGAGGCGKTRLAVEVALDVLARFRDGAVWVDLAPLTGTAAVDGAVAAAVGLHSSGEVTAERIAAHVGGRSLLIVLDNCEHVVARTAGLVATITAACPLVRVVATSREPLALTHESVWRIPSLGVPLSEHGDDLLDSEAGRLLVERIRLVRPHFEPDRDEARSLADVCRRLDGIPLALELAAARAATMAPREIAGLLDERFRLIGGARDSIARQRTLEASVAWSHQLLTGDEQSCFRRLSVFAGTFSLDAAVQMCSGVVTDPEGSITRLVECSLLVERAGIGPRLQMLEPVRWFARERLIDSGESEEVLGQHLAWAVDTAREFGEDLEGPRVTEALERLDEEVDNLRAAMDWAVDHEQLADAVRILAATSWYWVWRGRIIEMEQWLRRSGVDEARLAVHDRLALVWVRSELTWIRGDGIGDLVQEGISLAREAGDQAAEAKFLVSHSRFLAFTDPLGTIRSAPDQREMCRRQRIPFWVATSLVAETRANISIGRFDCARALLDQLRIEARSLHHPQLFADEISRRALVDRQFGRFEAVQRAVADIDAITAGFTTLNSQALVRAQAALVGVAQGRAETALVEMDELYHRYTVAGEYGYLPSIALPIVDALIDLGRPAEAVERFEPIWRVVSGSLSWRLRLGSARATALLAAGDIDGARSAFTAIVDEARAIPNEHEAAIADRFLAAIDRAGRRFADAETRLHRALEVQAGFGYPQYVADILEDLAGIELEHDRPAPAAVLFGAAGSIRESSGVSRRIGRQQVYDADIDELRRRLGDDLVEPWRRGAALTLEDAVALAQRGRGERGRPATGWESLTVTETKVAALVAEGHTNPEIAERLVMGRATVKTHVSNILRKLGLANRTQLAGRVAQRGTP